MSQHFFKTNFNSRPIRIQMGWDRPLQGYYMLIVREDIGDNFNDEYLYCNLDDPWLKDRMGLSKKIDHFTGVLRDFGIKVPSTMISEVRADGIGNVGNRVVDHGCLIL